MEYCYQVGCTILVASEIIIPTIDCSILSQDKLILSHNLKSITANIINSREELYFRSNSAFFLMLNSPIVTSSF